jgi:hypothetical protein
MGGRGSAGGGGRGGGGGGGGGGAAPAPSFARSESRSAPRPELAPSRADAPGPRAESRAAPPSSTGSAAPQIAAPPAVVPAPARVTAAAGTESIDVNRLTGRWDALVERMRELEQPMLATALSHASPVAVTSAGVVTIALDEPNDFYAHSITNGRGDILAALRQWFANVERVDLKRDDSAPAAPPKRMTDEMVRAERIAALKKRDPLLSAAIEALDLEVAD